MQFIDLRNCLVLTTKYSEFFITHLQVGAAVFQKYGDDYKLLKIAEIISKNSNQSAFTLMKEKASDNIAVYSTHDDEYCLEFACAK